MKKNILLNIILIIAMSILACSKERENPVSTELENVAEKSSTGDERSEEHVEKPETNETSVSEAEIVPEQTEKKEPSNILEEIHEEIQPYLEMNQGKYLSIHSLPDVDMKWKYSNEKEFILDEEKTLDDLDDFMDKVKGRQHVHVKMFSPQLMSGVSEILADYCTKITTLELVIKNNYLNDMGKNVHISTPPKCDTRLILTGLGKLPVSFSGARFDISADTLVVRHIQFTRNQSTRVLNAEIGSVFIGEDLLFNDNRIKREKHSRNRLVRRMETLVGLKSRLKSGKMVSYRLNHVNFVNNDVQGFVEIESDSLGKFDDIELNHVTVKGNHIRTGIDISAAKNAVVRESDMTGNTGLPVLYHCIPGTRIKIVSSRIPREVHSYRPLNQSVQGTPPKPLIKEDVEEF